jgi:GNAT superfamily N-acetyltransferase
MSHSTAPIATVLGPAGTRLRPLGPGDGAVVIDVFAAMSSASRASRYLVGLSRLSTAMVEALTAVDGARHAGWVAEIGGVPVGLARYVLMPGRTDTADVAVEVADAQQRRGIGAALVEAVAISARQHGVTRFVATLDADNLASRALLRRAGARIRVTAGVAEATGEFTVPAPGVLDARCVRSACWHCAARPALAS